MLIELIKRRIDEIIDLYEICDDDLIVLKGLPLEIMDNNIDKPDLNEIINNKASKYFMKTVYERSILTYEEFLFLKSFAEAEFKRIFILNNNLYFNLFPSYIFINEELKFDLIKHFDNSLQFSEEVENNFGIQRYSYLFQGFYGGSEENYVVYQEKQDSLSNEFLIEIFDESQTEIITVQSNISSKKINSEADYLDFIEEISRRNFEVPKAIYINLDNYYGNIEQLKSHIKILSKNLKSNINITSFNDFSYEVSSYREDFNNILKKYWGHESFRTLKIYDINKLQNGIKEVKEVSQENIINDMVEQAEKYFSQKPSDKRDIFITAPTGAGKSVLFQVPAIYLAEKYNLLTIVISPLIGLMKDQVKNLRNYKYEKAVTINSEVSPMEKQEIKEKINNGVYNILYISPETLIGQTDIQNLIGERKIGMFIIDEAHIVTTWGKQFRPDYWYLGDYIEKLKKNPNQNPGFLLATFTATAIYRGQEDMYEETKSSLYMFNPIIYLGYIKRENISFEIDNTKKARDIRSEIELDKFSELIELIKESDEKKQKILIYFPTISLLERFGEYARGVHLQGVVAKYHGKMTKEEKEENYILYSTGKKTAMIATKAFGMGIDISDIYTVAHFAPTGNVSDYIQEIGRSARKKEIDGRAYYHYNKKDLAHINSFHGMSSIKKTQLIGVIKKIYELYMMNRNSNAKNNKANSLLLDTESFSGIFNDLKHDEDNITNKIKSALLMIQKDFIYKIGFSPIYVRPIPMFSSGYFRIDDSDYMKIERKFKGCIETVSSTQYIRKLDLEKIWKQNYENFSFPKFKYYIYSAKSELDFFSNIHLTPAYFAGIKFKCDSTSKYKNNMTMLRSIIRDCITDNKYYSVDELADKYFSYIEPRERETKNKSRIIMLMQSFISTCLSYKDYFMSVQDIIFTKSPLTGPAKYQFRHNVDSFFKWIDTGMNEVNINTRENEMYIVDYSGNEKRKFQLILGFLESMDILNYSILGGENSQLYIYVNQIQALQNIINNGSKYENKFLASINYRHQISSKMLTYLFEGGFSTEEMWNIIEDYFLGTVPHWVLEEVKLGQEKKKAEYLKRKQKIDS